MVPVCRRTNVILVTVLIAHNVPEFIREGGSRRVSWRPSLKWWPYWIFFKGYHVSHCSGPNSFNVHLILFDMESL